MTNTPTQAAIEAAARAIVRRNYPSATDRDIDMMWEGYQPDAQAAIEAYRAAMREAGEGWQPIETAPRDGAPVLLWLPDADRGQPSVECAQWWGDCWWTNGGPNAGQDMDEWAKATHWMPLPNPPSA